MSLANGSADATLQALIANYESLKFNDNKTRIVCEWTGHEMPLRVDAVESYVNGHKYQTFLNAKINTTELRKYGEFLVDSNKPNRKNQLFCKLTMRHVNKQPTHIQKHLNGRRFLKAHAHWLECERTGQKFVPFCKQFGKKRAGLDEEMNEDDDSTLPEEMFDLIDESEYTKPSDEADSNENNQKNHAMELDVDKNSNHSSLNNKRKFDPKINKAFKIEPQKKK